MSKAKNVQLIGRFLVGNDEITPGINWTWFSNNNDSNVEDVVSIYQIAGSATDEAITLDDDTNVQTVILWDTAGIDSDSLTIKKNGSSDSIAVKPLHIDGQRLTSISVTNSSINTKYLGVARIYTSGTTTLIEGE